MDALGIVRALSPFEVSIGQGLGDDFSVPLFKGAGEAAETAGSIGHLHRLVEKLARTRRSRPLQAALSIRKVCSEPKLEPSRIDLRGRPPRLQNPKRTVGDVRASFR